MKTGREGHFAIGSPLLPGALAGASAWAAYAVAEGLVLTVANRMAASGAVAQPVHAGLSSLLFVIYPALGASLGATTAFLLRRLPPGARAWKSSAAAEAAGALPLLLVLCAAQLAEPVVWRLWLPVLGLAGVLATAHLLRVRSQRLEQALGFLVSPWAAASLLLATPWASDRAGDRPALAAAVALATAGSIVGLAYARSRLATRTGARPRRARRSYGRDALFYVAAAALLVAAGSRPQRVRRHEPPPRAASATTVVRDRPHLVLVTLDTVRADHLSLYGYERPTTPFLERLAAESTVYGRAIASAPMTLDSHATIFTGLYANRHGAHYHRLLCPEPCPLAHEHDTLAERLARIGYRTAGVVANHGYLGADFGLAQGFQTYDDRSPAPALAPAPPYTVRNAIAALLAPHLPPELSERVYRTAGEINRQTLDLLDELAGGNEPFFLFVNYMDAHEPYRPPAPYDRLFPGKDESFRRRDFVTLEREVLGLRRPVTPREREHLVSQYDGAIAYLDAELRRLVDRLRDLGLYDDLVLVVTSDHGEAFGERNLVDHQVSTYQDQIHVPLLVKLPRQRQPGRVEETVSLADLFPTLLGLAGAETPPAIDGVDLLAAERPRQRPVLSESYSNRFLEQLHPRFRRILRAVVRGTLKLHLSSTGSREVYELANDPDELRPLDPDGEPSRGLEADLAAWLELFPATSPDSPADFDEETRARLRALGYL